MLTCSFLLRPAGLLLAASILTSFQLHASEEHSLELQLLHAANRGDHSRVEHLLSAGADANKADNNGITPLYNACSQGHKNVAALLIRAGADINKADSDRWPPLYKACVAGHKEVAALLIRAGADVNYERTPLHIACLKGHVDVVALLIGAGIDISKADIFGYTPLYAACLAGHKEVAALLIEAGTDVNTADSSERTPLYIACSRRKKDMAELLSKHGAHSLDKRIIDELPEESKLLAERCNCIINERTALLKQLLDDPESYFLQKAQLPKVLQTFIIRDMLGRKNCDLQ